MFTGLSFEGFDISIVNNTFQYNFDLNRMKNFEFCNKEIDFKDIIPFQYQKVNPIQVVFQSEDKKDNFDLSFFSNKKRKRSPSISMENEKEILKSDAKTMAGTEKKKAFAIFHKAN